MVCGLGVCCSFVTSAARRFADLGWFACFIVWLFGWLFMMVCVLVVYACGCDFCIVCC